MKNIKNSKNISKAIAFILITATLISVFSLGISAAGVSQKDASPMRLQSAPAGPQKPAEPQKPSGSGPQVGDKLGDVLNSDVKTYINGQRIPCYNIKNKAVVIVGDLNNYGFDVVYDNATRTSKITRNYNKQVTGIRGVQNTTSGQSGTVAFSYVYTNITATLGGKKIESFNIQGNLAIFFEDLGDYGSFKWDSSTRSSMLILYLPEPASVTLSKSSATVDVGKTTTLTAIVMPQNAGNKAVTWTSSNTRVATVSSSGIVTGVSKGTATITAKTSNGKTASCSVTVNQPASSSGSSGSSGSSKAEYYSGTSYRTFTDVTGTQLKEIYTADNGVKINIYDYVSYGSNQDNYGVYLDYLFNIDFEIYDYEESADLFTIYLTNGTHAILLSHYAPDDEIWIILVLV